MENLHFLIRVTFFCCLCNKWADQRKDIVSGYIKPFVFWKAGKIFSCAKQSVCGLALNVVFIVFADLRHQAINRKLPLSRAFIFRSQFNLGRRLLVVSLTGAFTLPIEFCGLHTLVCYGSVFRRLCSHFFFCPRGIARAKRGKRRRSVLLTANLNDGAVGLHFDNAAIGCYTAFAHLITPQSPEIAGNICFCFSRGVGQPIRAIFGNRLVRITWPPVESRPHLSWVTTVAAFHLAAVLRAYTVQIITAARPRTNAEPRIAGGFGHDLPKPHCAFRA